MANQIRYRWFTSQYTLSVGDRVKVISTYEISLANNNNNAIGTIDKTDKELGYYVRISTLEGLIKGSVIAGDLLEAGVDGVYQKRVGANLVIGVAAEDSADSLIEIYFIDNAKGSGGGGGSVDPNKYTRKLVASEDYFAGEIVQADSTFFVCQVDNTYTGDMVPNADYKYFSNESNTQRLIEGLDYLNGCVYEGADAYCGSFYVANKNGVFAKNEVLPGENFTDYSPKVKTGVHTTIDEDGALDVLTGGDIDQIPTNFHVAENHYTKEEADVGSDTKPGEMDIRSPKIEFYGEKTKYSYYNVSDGESLTDITTDKVSKKQIMFLSASKRDLGSVVYFHEDYLKDRPQVSNIATLQEFYLDINGMRFNTSRYNVPVDAGYRITYNGKITLNGNPINTNENTFVENSKSGTYDTKAFDNTNTDHMFIRARIEIVSTSTAEMNIIADPTSKLFALKMTSNHLLTFMKIQPLFFQDVKASIVQGQKNRYEISQEYVQELLESVLYTGFLDISIDLEI